MFATIVYTSGTTGPPKGVLQTHGNHLATVQALMQTGLARAGDVAFFFLPPAPPFAPSVANFAPDAFKFGTVGRPLPCCEVRIAKDGEIIARGANVALGYHRRPEATAEAWDADGWFHTGDIGEFDAERFLRITDRKKDLIKTSGGKYVAPQKIENLLKLQPHVSQAVVIGDNRQ